MGDKAGTRKWRAFHGKLPLEGAMGHHSDVELFVRRMLLFIVVTALHFRSAV